jgi:2-dehydro-3-deoxy-phosphogluconate/2-dehydro-3-deoxy-6-phosphogalactonate aldolase
LVSKIVPTLTPFDKNKINTQKLRNHVEQLFSDGVDFTLLCGTTGLGTSLTVPERVEALQSLRDLADRVIFHVGSLNLYDSLELAKIGKDLGVCALASLPPYYFPRIRDEWVVKHLVEISKVHPTFLYNFPLAAGYDATAPIAKRIVEAGGNLIGVKDTVNDLAHMLLYKYELGKDFLVYTGPESVVLAAARIGLDGSVAGAGNYATELFVNLLRDPAAPDAIDAQRLMTQLADIPRKYGQWSANYALAKIIRGYDVGDPRPPFFPIAPEDVEKMKKEAREVLASPKNQKLASHFKRFGA